LLSTRGATCWARGSTPAAPEHGFLYCVIAITVVYALILPVLLLIPKELLATADGQPNPALEAQTLAEIGEPAATPA